MKPIVAIRYRDASYLAKRIIKGTTLPIYVAVGRPITSKNHVIISFTEENGTPIRGLLVPKEALILVEEEKKTKKVDMQNFLPPNNSDVGIFWKDIVYFENGKIPNKPTQMYTEGQLYLQTSDSLVIKNPETIIIKKDNMGNYPKIKPTFFFVPKVLITGIEFYEKKL